MVLCIDPFVATHPQTRGLDLIICYMFCCMMDLQIVLMSYSGYTDDEVVTAIKELRVEKRYKEDVWT